MPSLGGVRNHAGENKQQHLIQKINAGRREYNKVPLTKTTARWNYELDEKMARKNTSKKIYIVQNFPQQKRKTFKE